MRAKMEKDKQLTIGIVGFGAFGQFLARRLARHGHRILVTSRSNYEKEAAEMGAHYFQDVNDFCEEHPDVVILSTSILSTRQVLASLPVQRLRRSTLFVDVLSVKVFPKQLFLTELPPEVDILCTHPMFGPDSGKNSWAGLNFMFDKVRIGEESNRQERVDQFLKVFRDEGCRMVEMTCEEHDRQAASTQFITHTVGRVLGAMELESTDINTKGFEALLNLVNNTANDSFDLYYGLFLYNINATDELERLEAAFDKVKEKLFRPLHDIARNQLFPGPVVGQTRHAAETPSHPPARSEHSPTSNNGSKSLMTHQ